MRQMHSSYHLKQEDAVRTLSGQFQSNFRAISEHCQCHLEVIRASKLTSSKKKQKRSVQSSSGATCITQEFQPQVYESVESIGYLSPVLPERAVSERFPSGFRAILGQFQSNYREISEQFQRNFRAVSEQSQGSFRAISKQF